MDLLLALLFSLLAVLLALPLLVDWRPAPPSLPPPSPRPRGYRFAAEEELVRPPVSRSLQKPPPVRPRRPPCTIDE